MTQVNCSNNGPQRVRLVRHDSQWAKKFASESALLEHALEGVILEVHHIGSTAIPRIRAKPIIDMLAVVGDISQLDAPTPQLESLGYEGLGEFGIPGRRYFRKSDSEGNRTHQIHAFQTGSPQIERHLAFRDFMSAHPKYARQYEALKVQLAKRYPEDIGSYADGKDEFIQEMDRKAADWRGVLNSSEFQEKVARVMRDHVEIAPYNPRWPELFRQERDYLRWLVPCELLGRIEHFGSTAVPGLAAKPIVDMLVEIYDLDAARESFIPFLEADGYDYFWRPTISPGDGWPWYAWLIKRNANGERTYHLHLIEPDFPHWGRLIFRDYLIAHPDVARDYEQLKIQLAAAHPNDREAYTIGKSDFIAAIMQRALPKGRWA
ncbi:MAG TPA: GrpB family protein [Chthoniobacter sp.]|jgi:GrpB-like predicted nucleotidyltransferase (UPF0157 family)